MHIFLFIVIIMQSCITSERKGEHAIGFSQCIGSDDWRKQMLDEMHQELEFHPEISLIYKDALGDNANQIQQIEQLIELNVEVLIVSPNESEPLTAIIDKAFKKGIPVILIDRKTNSNNYTTFIGADNYEIGRTAGEMAVQLLHEKGRILEIFGLQGSSPAIERHKGFADVINQHKSITIVAQVYGKWLGSEAYKELTRNINQSDSIDLVFAHNDVMALAAYNFFDSIQTARLKFIGVDGLAGAGNGMDLVSKNMLTSTILYPTGGEEAIRQSVKIIIGDSVPKNIKLNSTVIDEKNSNIMSQQANKMLSQRQTIANLQDNIGKQLKVFNSQQTLIYGLFGSLVILILLLVWVFRSLRIINSQKAMIQKQNHHLEMLNNTKDKFFSIVAHDLRSPLYSLQSFSNLIINDYDIFSKDEMIQVMQQLNNSVENSIRMADNLITWARVQMNEFQYNEEVFGVNEVVSNVCEVYKDIALKKGINFSYSVEDSLTILGDKNQVEFIIRNLVNNAIKFTHIGGFVNVLAKIGSLGMVEIVVADSGLGISDSLKKDLFLLSADSKSLGTAGEKGTGLGLMLSAEFIRFNKGQIHIESEVNKGTTFYAQFKGGIQKS